MNQYPYTHQNVTDALGSVAHQLGEVAHSIAPDGEIHSERAGVSGPLNRIADAIFHLADVIESLPLATPAPQS